MRWSEITDELLINRGGSTEGDGDVFVLNALDTDTDDAPEILFGRAPVSVERLQGDGSWKTVPFRKTGETSWTLDSAVEMHRPAVFRWK